MLNKLINTEILKVLPHITLYHPNIAKLIDLAELKPEVLSNTYLQEGSYIYALINLLDHQNITYIGQTGMHRRKVLDRKKLWTDLERAPMQRDWILQFQ